MKNERRQSRLKFQRAREQEKRGKRQQRGSGSVPGVRGVSFYGSSGFPNGSICRDLSRQELETGRKKTRDKEFRRAWQQRLVSALRLCVCVFGIFCFPNLLIRCCLLVLPVFAAVHVPRVKFRSRVYRVLYISRLFLSRARGVDSVKETVDRNLANRTL